jgi:hypothetical protein
MTKAVLAGHDASGKLNLWVTDGTSAGTSELGITGVASAGILAFGNPDLTFFGGEVLFAGEDSAGHVNLWVTDGTLAGTVELVPAGAYFYGLFDNNSSSSYFTLLGSKALFEGVDASGHNNLWVTDGTSAGTSELVVAGAYISGLIHQYASPDFTVLGSKLLFIGQDTSGHLNLWVTDGTAAGTSEVQVA